MANKRGLFKKYIVSKTDGSEVEPQAEYFVLRLDDHFGEEKDTPSNIAHRRACRHAARVYAIGIAPWYPKLSEDLLGRYTINEREYRGRRRPKVK